MAEHKPPKHIFLQWDGIDTEDMPEFDCPINDGDITWSQDAIYDTDIKYIKADEAQVRIDLCMAARRELQGRLEARDTEIHRLEYDSAEWERRALVAEHQQTELLKLVQKDNAKIDQLTEELDMYHNGYQGSCMACEPVGEENQRLANELCIWKDAAERWWRESRKLNQIWWDHIRYMSRGDKG